MDKTTSPRADRIVCAAAVATVGLGILLSRRVEPGVRVEAVTLADDTPALQFIPATAGPHPVALLAHGVTASKETLFRLGEALAAAGFSAFAVDLPGHGESRRPFGAGLNAGTLEAVARGLGKVDVFVGHSMGAYAGAESVRTGRIGPRLFVALGALPDLGERGPPLVLLAGRFEEAVSPRLLRARAGARVTISAWSDHALEPYDPELVDAAVDAACAAVGTTPPPSPGRWRWRSAGLVLAALGALGVGDRLPELVQRLARVRGLQLSLIVVAAIAATSGSWIGAAPVLRRIPVQLAAMALVALGVIGAGKLRIPRWAFAALAAVLAAVCVVSGAYFQALFASLVAIVLLGGALVGWIAARSGDPRQADIAFAVLVGYALGQWIPMTV